MSEITRKRPAVERLQAPPERLPDSGAVFLDCHITPSIVLLKSCALVLAVTLACLLLALVPLWRTAPLTALTALVAGTTCVTWGALCLWRHWCAQHWQLRLDLDGWQLSTVGGVWQRVEIHPRALVWPQLVIVGFLHPSCRGPQWLVLAADSCQPEQWRRLRVWLVTRFGSARPY